MNLLNNCTDKTPYNDLKWINEPLDYHFNDGNVTINVPPMSDFFRDPAGNCIKDSAPFLHIETMEDFVLTTRVNVEMIEEYDSACLMIMKNEKNWAKVCYEYIKGIPTIVSVVTKDTSDDCVSSNVGHCNPYLRIQKLGNCFGFHYSLDYITWEMVRYFYLDCSEKIKVGIVAQSPIGQGCNVKFEFVDLEIRKVNDVRVV